MNLNFDLLYQYAQRPALFAKSTVSLWDDEHISKEMLKAHLDPDWEAASRQHRFIDASVDWIVEHTALPSRAKLLDLGCGPGLYTQRFAKRGFDVTGVDFSRRSINYAQEQAAKEGLSINYIYQNYLTLAFDGTFDLATMIYCDFGVLSDEEAKDLLKRVYTALNPGGLFLLDVFTPVRLKAFQDGERRWELSEAGFWRPVPYVALFSRYIYEEVETFVEQFVVMDQEERIEVYRNWNHCYSKQTITPLLESAGFKELFFATDVAGKAYSGDSETLCIVARK
jgi:SAM-dependent methyltransferase